MIRRTARGVAKPDPRRMRLSPHFLLSDFIGNHSVYSRGLANDFRPIKGDLRLDNGIALCQEGLEPLLRDYGPISVGYGAITPEVSDKVVTYQDPRKPSHHLWSLGAAADIVVHRWVAGEFRTVIDLTLPESAIGAPISLAHAIDYLDIPYSRLITYSESPYLCLAISAQECASGAPRKAFYENRYAGRPKVKPMYMQYSTEQARSRALQSLQEAGLQHPWEGAGHPTYHGGGRRQYHHMRVSKYTMVSDWLFDLKSISKGAKNVPSFNHSTVEDSFAAAGLVYDWLITELGIPRASIVAGYVSHLNPYFDPENDWREGTIKFTLALPEYIDIHHAVAATHCQLSQARVETREFEGFLEVTLDVDDALTTLDFDE